MKLTQARRTYAAKHVAAMAHFKPRPRDWGSNRVPAGEFCKVTIQCGRWRHNAALAKPTMLPTPDVLVLLSQKARADFGRVEALPSRSGRGRACDGPFALWRSVRCRRESPRATPVCGSAPWKSSV